MDICKAKFIFGRAHLALAIALMAGLLTAQAPAWAGSVRYSYDALGRVTQVVYTEGSKTTTIAYSYDAAGNRTAVTTTQSP